MTEYRVITTDAAWAEGATDALERAVREAMGEGWQPIGGVALAVVRGDYEATWVASQAMTR